MRGGKMIGKVVKIGYFGQIIHALVISHEGPYLTLQRDNGYLLKTTINHILEIK